MSLLLARLASSKILRSALTGVVGFVAYGGWAYYVNLGYGDDVELRATIMTGALTDTQSDISLIAPVPAGHYEVRLAQTPQEIQLAQALRYRVMYAEKGSKPDLRKMKAQADIDEWDARAHHIIVVDRRSTSTQVVGTLRLTSNFTLMQARRFTLNRLSISQHFGSTIVTCWNWAGFVLTRQVAMV